MKQNTDILLRQALRARAQYVHPDEQLLISIRREIRIRKEEKNMKFTTKKIIAIAAAVCLLCASCLAAVQLNAIETHSLTEVNTYAEMQNLARETIPGAKSVQRFENGLEFQSGGTSETFARDAEGNAMDEKIIGLQLYYQDAAGKNLVLDIEPEQVMQINSEIPAQGYSSDTYKFVPPDYVPTEEERAMEAEGDLFLSYGSGEVSIGEMEFYSWQQDGLCYSLTAFKCNFGETEMSAMAAQIMG